MAPYARRLGNCCYKKTQLKTDTFPIALANQAQSSQHVFQNLIDPFSLPSILG